MNSKTIKILKKKGLNERIYRRFYNKLNHIEKGNFKKLLSFMPDNRNITPENFDIVNNKLGIAK